MWGTALTGVEDINDITSAHKIQNIIELQLTGCSSSSGRKAHGFVLRFSAWHLHGFPLKSERVEISPSQQPPLLTRLPPGPSS